MQVDLNRVRLGHHIPFLYLRAPTRRESLPNVPYIEDPSHATTSKKQRILCNLYRACQRADNIFIVVSFPFIDSTLELGLTDIAGAMPILA
jgi:hypothetical protein